MITFLHIILVLVLVFRWKWLGVDKSSPWLPVSVLTVRVAVGWWFTGYYLQSYGGGDMHVYLNDGLELADLFFKSPAAFVRVLAGLPVSGDDVRETLNSMQLWFDRGVNLHYNDARTVIRFHALIGLFSGGQLLVHLLWSNVAAMSGALALLRFFFTPDDRGKPLPLPSLILLFLPGSLIWSSMLLKEPLLLFALGISLRYFQLWIRSRRLDDLLVLFIGFGSFLLMKSFWLLVLVPGLAAWFIFREARAPARVVLTSYGLTLTLVTTLGFFLPACDIPSLLYGQQLESWRYAIYLNSGSLFHPVRFAPGTFSCLKHLPEALSFAMFRPWPGEFTRYVNLPFILENLMVLSLCVLSVRRALKASLSYSYGTLIAISGAVLILAVCGYICCNTGSLVRYRLPGLWLLTGALWSLALQGIPPRPNNSSALK